MRAVISNVFCCSLLTAAASSQSTGSEPSPMEAFAAHQGVRTTWSNEVAQWVQDGTRFVPFPSICRKITTDTTKMKAAITAAPP
jgi:hypothetical protein